MAMRMIIKRSFYNRNTVQVAQDLLGCFLVREFGGKIMKVKITETEAYRGFHDAASHASRGKTQRNEVMFGEPGHAYVYLIYGMYNMLNIVTEKKEYPAAVLIRGGEITPPSPLQGERTGVRLNGPGKLTKFLKIDRSLNGHDLTMGQKLWLEYDRRDAINRVSTRRHYKIIKSPRVGVDYARHAKEWKWNFRVSTNY